MTIGGIFWILSGFIGSCILIYETFKDGRGDSDIFALWLFFTIFGPICLFAGLIILGCDLSVRYQLKKEKEK